MGKWPALWSVPGARRILRENHAPGGYVRVELAVLRRIDHIVAPGDDGSGEPAGPERTPVGGGVPALGQAGHYNSPQPRQLEGQLLRRLLGVEGRAPGAHHGDGNLLIKEGHPPLGVQQQGRVVDIAQADRVAAVPDGDDPDAQPVAVPQDLIGPVQGLVLQGLCRAGGHPLHQQIGPLLPVKDGVRLAEAVQQRQLQNIPNPRQARQPEPILQ